MAVKGKEAVFLAEEKLGTPYGSGPGEIDCINLIKYVIRNGTGGVKTYTTAHTNALWQSRNASAKYKDITWWRTLSGNDTGRAGEVLGMCEKDACSHVGIACGDGTAIHASKSHGEVVRTQVKGGGWTHAMTHRYIDIEDAANAYENTADVEETRMTATVRAGGGLRQRESPGGKYMQMIPDGARIYITQTRDGWGLTRWRGYEGWVSMNYVYQRQEEETNGRYVE